MQDFSKQRKTSAGFTLIEIMVVLTLLSVLIVVGVGKFFDLNELGQKNVCRHNRAMIEDQMRIKWAEKIVTEERPKHKNEETFVRELFAAVYDATSDAAHPTCPSTNKASDYYIQYKYGKNVGDTGEYHVLCKHHRDGVTIASLADKATIDQIVKNVSEAYKLANMPETSGYFVHSGANDLDRSVASYVERLTAEGGATMRELGMASWEFNNQHKILYWTPYSIDGLEDDDVIPVFRYNSKTGTYTVWEAIFKKGAGNSSTNSPDTIRYDIYKMMDNAGDHAYNYSYHEKNQTYDNMLALMDKLQEQYGDPPVIRKATERDLWILNGRK